VQPRRLLNYVNGRWVESEASRTLEVENPATGEVLALVPLSTAADTTRAIEAAFAAFPAWRDTPVSRRASHMHRLLRVVTDREEDIARVLVREMGKSLPDARAETKRMIENIETACAMPVLQQGDRLIGAATGIDGEVLRLPVGVFGLIAPFNFPAMVPFWFIPYALAAGNTYVAKPSERVPLTMELITQLMEECGLPPGVFNLVNGSEEVGRTLMEHPHVAGVSMVGSTRVARIVAETCARNGKRFQAMGGAKNHLVVMPDAHMDQAVRNMVSSCYGCAGQRCMAASVIVGVGEESYRSVVERFVAVSREVVLGDPLDPAVENNEMAMGPVISAAAKRRILDLINQGVKEGATLALDGRGVHVAGREGGHYVGPTVFTDVEPGMAIHRTEIFGPVVVIMRVADLDEAIRVINEHEYGNGASIYTQDGAVARKFKLATKAGMIGINIGIPAPVASLPFGGSKASFLSDIKAQGKSVVRFFTEEKIVTERYWAAV